MEFYTIGYGGRLPKDFVALLTANNINTVVDVRLRPDRATMGTYTKTKTKEKGIEFLLSEHNIGYISVIELGNIFLSYHDWRERYQLLIDQVVSLLIEQLENLPASFCLLCAEKLVKDCHREQIANYLSRKKGWQVHHIE